MSCNRHEAALAVALLLLWYRKLSIYTFPKSTQFPDYTLLDIEPWLQIAKITEEDLHKAERCIEVECALLNEKPSPFFLLHSYFPALYWSGSVQNDIDNIILITST